MVYCKLLPFRFPVTQEHFAVYAFDDRVLAWKVPVKQRLRDARARGQFAGLASESMFGKEGNGGFDNRLRSLLPRHAVGSPPNCAEAAFHRLAGLSLWHPRECNQMIILTTFLCLSSDPCKK